MKQVSVKDWPTYCGSSKELLKDIKDLGKESFSFEIIELCKGRGILRAREIQWQVMLDVLDGTWYNQCIGHLKWMNPGTHSPETIEKIRAAKSKLANIYDMKGNVVARSVVIKEWALKNGYDKDHLTKTARGERKHHKGLRAEYIESNET